MLSRGGLGLLCVLLSACGASGVPEFRIDELHRPALPGVTPRTVKLVVLERRSPIPDDTEETVPRVREAVAETLKRAGIQVLPESPNELQVTIGHPARVMEGFSREACLEMTARLTRPGDFAQVSAIRCFEWRHLLGFSLGSDLSKTFQPTTNEMLEQLDAQVSRLPGHVPVNTAPLADELEVHERHARVGRHLREEHVQIAHGLAAADRGSRAGRGRWW